jgi:hypothetical protein
MKYSWSMNSPAAQKNMIIKIGKYLIRDWEMDDEASLVKYANNPKVADNLRNTFPCPYTKTDAQALRREFGRREKRIRDVSENI